MCDKCVQYGGLNNLLLESSNNNFLSSQKSVWLSAIKQLESRLKTCLVWNKKAIPFVAVLSSNNEIWNS